MKRAFLLALTLSFVVACSPKPATTGHGGPKNANQTEGVAGGPTTIPVVITVGTKPNSDTYFLSVAPYSVTLSASNGDQIEWIISNPFPTVNLSNIQISKFKGGTPANSDPFGNGGAFNFSYVAPRSTAFRLSGTTNRYGTYDYEVTGTATITGGPPIPLTMDPRLVVGD